MLDLTVTNIRILSKALVSKLMNDPDSPKAKWVESTSKRLAETLADRQRELIVLRIHSLRSELDNLQKRVEHGDHLYGGTRITDKAAAVDEAVNTAAGMARTVEELAALLTERPELA